MDNNQTPNSKESIFEKVKDYIETYIELKKLTIIEKAVLTLSSVILVILLAIVFIMVLLFASVGLALYLGDIFNSNYIGFFAVALIYIIILVIVLLMSKNYIKNPLVNLFIAKIFNSK